MHCVVLQMSNYHGLFIKRVWFWGTQVAEDSRGCLCVRFVQMFFGHRDEFSTCCVRLVRTLS